MLSVGASEKAIVFPACAGVILVRTDKIRPDLSVPRMCGGDPIFISRNCGRMKCSPHVRG